MNSILDRLLTLEYLMGASVGEGIEIAVIDSGVDASHPSLRGKVKRACVIEKSPYGYKAVELPDGDMATDFFAPGHGTGVASTILDVAPGAQITSVQVLNQSNSSAADALLLGLEWALDNKIQLINMSLAMSTSNLLKIEPLFKLCERAYKQDAILVTSCQNGSGPIGFPAQFSSVLSVNMDENAALDKYQITYLAKSLVEYKARGVNVEVATPGGEYALKTGTSFAAPHVTGLCALILSLYPDLLPCEIKTVLSHIGRTTNSK